ncbi:MAG: type II toxin-antitoxin system VapC family toxin, partial [Methanobacteriaceae archaeon]
MIFIDASFVIGLISPKDQWHEKAKDVYFSIKNRETIMSNVVLAETINSIKFLGGKTGELVYKTLKDENKIIYLKDEKIYDKSIKTYLKYDGSIGYSDCTTIELMKDLG